MKAIITILLGFALCFGALGQTGGGTTGTTGQKGGTEKSRTGKAKSKATKKDPPPAKAKA
jgi:hypothetical protein